MDHCCIKQLRLPPHFYPVTNRVVCHFISEGVGERRTKDGEELQRKLANPGAARLLLVHLRSFEENRFVWEKSRIVNEQGERNYAADGATAGHSKAALLTASVPL